ncbi:uncharacterized protein EV420DRAFT_1485897 [Desarmillaria tabescens]|uniref:Uncharacterized protein n=1 Tax=Armillaria tabescens TaxID=1929756 RepID=A0AA39MND1_ARMTA|nr:uncharacterized protein EV420DRAFT_1485897 [Desarmillaria tabescens]KAK0440687.1 hypothetical protein EV420DRAFT_1485897 [Desarmillaria tabescens]
MFYERSSSAKYITEYKRDIQEYDGLISGYTGSEEVCMFDDQLIWQKHILSILFIVYRDDMKYYFTDSNGYSRPCMYRNAGIEFDDIRHFIVTPNRRFSDTFIHEFYAFTDSPSTEPFNTPIPDIKRLSMESARFATPAFFDSTHRYRVYRPAEDDTGHWAFDFKDRCVPELTRTTRADGVSYGLVTSWADLVRSDMLEARLVVRSISTCGHFPPNMIVPNSFDPLSVLYLEHDSPELPLRIIHLCRDVFLDLCGFIIWWISTFEEGSHSCIPESGWTFITTNKLMSCRKLGVVVFPLKDELHMNIEKWVRDDVGVFCLFPEGTDLWPRWTRLDYLSSGVFTYHRNRNIPAESEPSMERDIVALNAYSTHFTAIQWVATETISSIPQIPADSKAQVVEFPGWKPHPITPREIRFFTWACDFAIHDEGGGVQLVTIWRYKLRNYLDGSILPSSVEKILHDSKSYGEVMSWGAAKEYYAPSCAPCMVQRYALNFREDMDMTWEVLYFYPNQSSQMAAFLSTETPIPGPIFNSTLLPSDVPVPFNGSLQDILLEAEASPPSVLDANSLSVLGVPLSTHVASTKRVFCGSIQETWNLGDKPKIRVIQAGYKSSLLHKFQNKSSVTQKYVGDPRFLPVSKPKELLGDRHGARRPRKKGKGKGKEVASLVVETT